MEARTAEAAMAAAVAARAESWPTAVRSAEALCGEAAAAVPLAASAQGVHSCSKTYKDEVPNNIVSDRLVAT